MTRWRFPLLGLVAWLAVVAVGSTAVWVVISRVGEDLGADVEAPGAVAAGTVPQRQATRPGHPIHRSPAATPSGPAAPGAATSRPTGEPSAAPSHTPATTPSAGAGAPAPQPVRPRTRQRTWQGTGGYVTARCRGGDVGLVVAQPDAGYAVEVGDRGPETLEVSFDGRTEDSGRHVEVRARCAAGEPVFAVGTGNGGGSGGGGGGGDGGRDR